jgi:DNA-binding transcriptional LysR family regulator
VDIRQLRYFLAVASERSFTRGAERLNMAQPPLSRRVQDLEIELGVKLFDRESRPLRLTPAGQLLLEQGSQVVQRMDQLHATMSRFVAGQKTRFAIGLVPSTMYSRFVDVIRLFRDRAPNVDLRLYEMDTLEQVAALRDGRINAGFDRIRVDDATLRHQVLREEGLVGVLPAEHPRLADPRPLELEELAALPLIVYPREPRPSYADAVLALFAERGLTPMEVHEVRELQTAMVMVAAGAGASVVPESVRRLGRPDVGFLDLATAQTIPIMLRTRVDEESPALDVLYAALGELYRDMGLPAPTRPDEDA